MNNIPTNLNSVKLPKELRRDLNHERYIADDGNLFTEQSFHEQLDSYDHFDILTYSITPMYIFTARPIHRLLYHVGNVPKTTKRAIQVSGTHAKLWICYRSPNDKFPDIFIGSANATEMTLHEILIRATGKQANPLFDHFNRIWQLNS